MYLGIDLGTSGLKAVLINDAQTIIASHTAPLTVNRPHDGWNEQAPQDWIAALNNAISGLRRENPGAFAKLRGIGLSGQMHGATLLDKNDQVLRHCILWNDTRNHEEAAALDADPVFRETTGNIIFPGFTAPKLSWVQKYEPETFEKITRILLPKDFVRLWLTGEVASEMSDASGTGWLDVDKRRWSETLLQKTGLSLAHMPVLTEGTEPTGVLRPALAEEWGAPAGVVVAGGGGDNAMAAAGLGIINQGDAFLSLGTSGVLFAGADAYRPAPESAVHTFCHAVPNTWHQMGVVLSATDSLNWLATIVNTTPEDLTQELGEKLRERHAPLFLPYLAGERTPHNDARIRGAFMGLSHLSDRNDLTHAVLEGIAFALKDCQSALQSAGTVLSRLLITGGGARSRYWVKLIASVFNIPVDTVPSGDFGASFGAARMGIIAAERANSRNVLTKPTHTETIFPSPGCKHYFEDRYAAYRRLYPATKEISQ